MPDSSSASAPAYLFKLERSRWLWAWWLGLHLVLGLTAALICPWPALTAAAAGGLGIHAFKRRPRASPLVVYSDGGLWGLPAEGLFELKLSPKTRYGPFWVELVFDNPVAPRVLLVRDQLEGPAWRRLQLALGGPA